MPGGLLATTSLTALLAATAIAFGVLLGTRRHALAGGESGAGAPWAVLSWGL